MRRSIAVGLFLGVAAVAIGVAFWALGSGESGDAGGGRAAGAGDAPAANGAATDPSQPGVKGRAATTAKRAPDPAADLKAVAGVVTGEGGKPVAGATVACLLVPDGEPTDDLRRAREALRGVIDDDRDLNVLLRQLGRGDAAPAPEQMQRAMRTGQRIGGRLAADPGALSRALRIGRDFGVGLETDAALAELAATTTDDRGAFRFDGLAPGSVELRVTAPRFQRRKSRASVGDVNVKLQLAPAGVVTGRVIRDGEPVAGAEIRFRAASVRSGADGRFRYDGAKPPREPVLVSAKGCVPRGLWAPVEPGRDGEELVFELDAAGRVTGRVVSAAGAPVAGAVVTFAPDASGMFALFMPALSAETIPIPPPQAVTKEDGTYEMTEVPARTVRLRCDKDGWIGAAAEPVRVPADGIAENVDFKLTRESYLEGRIADRAGRPVADAEVRVDVPAQGVARMMAQMGTGSYRANRSGPDGSYRVGGLPAGTLSVTVDGEGWLRKKASVVLASESSARQDFVLEPGYRVAGKVVAPDGKPIPGATVSVAWKPTDRPANPFMQAALEERTGATGADGRFAVEGLQDGPYDVTGAAPGFLAAAQNGISPGAEEVVLVLGAAATIRGVVTNTDGTPVDGATVLRKVKARAASTNPFLARVQRDPSIAAGAGGVFEMTGIPPGPHEIYARAKGYADSAPVKVQATEGAVTEGVTLVLPPGSSVSGRMTRKADGSALGGAVLWVRTDEMPFTPTDAAEILGSVPAAPTDSVSATTNDDGAFVLAGLSPGRVTIEARAAGCAPRTVAAVEVGTSGLAVEMSQGGQVEGTVWDQEGRTAEGTTVILQQGMMGTGFVRTATSARGGGYRIERIPPGSYSIFVLDPESPMGMAGMKSVAVRDGETTRQDFGKRAAGGPVEGAVTADGKPVDGAAVMLMGGPGGMQVAQTGPDGRFRFDHAEAGEYSVTVQRGAMGTGGTQTGKVKVAPDGTVSRIDLELSTLTVEGVVVDAETGKGVGLAQAVLLAPGAGGGASLEDVMARQKGQSFTDGEGRFRIGGVPSGTFRLRVTASGFAEAEVEGVAAGGQPVRVALTRGIEFTVTVLAPDGKPVSGANLVPQDAGGREGIAFDFTLARTTGADGVAKFRLQPGRYVLRATATGYPIATQQVDAAQGQATIRLEAGGILEVVVRGAGGTLVSGATVKLLDAQGQEVREGMTMSNFLGTGGSTDDKGRARREGLSPGTLKVVVTTPAGKTAKADAVITAGATTTVDIATE